MKPEIKARWLTALRSGEYQQTQKTLHDEKGFCCLGVLCDLYVREHNLEWNPISVNLWGVGNVEKLSCVDGASWEVPPRDVVAWAELGHSNPHVAIDSFDHAPIAALNDVHGYTFEQIADVIENQL